MMLMARAVIARGCENYWRLLQARHAHAHAGKSLA
jgi:hypothetical protein